MEISEIVLYVALGFGPTLLALEASWRMALKKSGGLGIGKEAMPSGEKKAKGLFPEAAGLGVR